MNREVARRITFRDWSNPCVDPNVLVMTGFYHLGPLDSVYCWFCKVIIGGWVNNDNEVTEHQRLSQNCPVIKRRATNNVPINVELLDRTLPPIHYDVCGTRGD